MADSITIAGIALKLVDFVQGATIYRGVLEESFDNSVQNGRDKPKRAWRGRTLPIAPSVEASLRTAVESAAVTCSGLVLPAGSVSAWVTVEESARGPDVSGGRPNWGAVNVTLSLSLREA